MCSWDSQPWECFLIQRLIRQAWLKTRRIHSKWDHRMVRQSSNSRLHCKQSNSCKRHSSRFQTSWETISCLPLVLKMTKTLRPTITSQLLSNLPCKVQLFSRTRSSMLLVTKMLRTWQLKLRTWQCRRMSPPLRAFRPIHSQATRPPTSPEMIQRIIDEQFLNKVMIFMEFDKSHWVI